MVVASFVAAAAAEGSRNFVAPHQSLPSCPQRGTTQHQFLLVLGFSIGERLFFYLEVLLPRLHLGGLSFCQIVVVGFAVRCHLHVICGLLVAVLGVLRLETYCRRYYVLADRHVCCSGPPRACRLVDLSLGEFKLAGLGAIK